jgi:hypothetical protein
MASKKSAGKAKKKAAGTSRSSAARSVTPGAVTSRSAKPRVAAKKKKSPSGAVSKPVSKPSTKSSRAAAKAPKRPMSKPKPAAGSANASQLIDQRIRDLDDWRGETLARMRTLILEADPAMVEECKWVKVSNPSGVPVWSHAGIVCTGESYKQAVKLTFAKGAKLPDPSRLFNSSLEGSTRRAIDIHEGEAVDASAFKALVQAAVALNEAGQGR